MKPVPTKMSEHQHSDFAGNVTHSVEMECLQCVWVWSGVFLVRGAIGSVDRQGAAVVTGGAACGEGGPLRNFWNRLRFLPMTLLAIFGETS